MTSAQGNILFGTGSGQLGFSLLRLRIDPNESWGNEPSNAATAHAHGAKVLGTPWTPPASMKNNNSTICGDLLASQYAAYAYHLNQAVTAIGLDFVSFQNEPDFCPNPGYESSNPTPTEIETWMANNAPTVGKPIVMPEAVNFNNSYSDPTLNNSTAAQPRHLCRRPLLRRRQQRPPERAQPRQTCLGNRALHQRHGHRHCHDCR